MTINVKNWWTFLWISRPENLLISECNLNGNSYHLLRRSHSTRRPHWICDLPILIPDRQGVQDPSPTFDDHWQQLVWEGQACAAAAYYVTGILVQPWARKTSQLYRWLRNLLIMKVGRRRTERLCQRLVIKLTSCSSRLWHLPLLLSMLDTASCNG